MSGILLPGRAKYKDMTLDINDQLKASCDTKEYMQYIDAEELTYNRRTGTFLENAKDLRWKNLFRVQAIASKEYEDDLGIEKYDIDFFGPDGMKYEYDISVADGTILDKEAEFDD